MKKGSDRGPCSRAGQSPRLQIRRGCMKLANGSHNMPLVRVVESSTEIHLGQTRPPASNLTKINPRWQILGTLSDSPVLCSFTFFVRGTTENQHKKRRNRLELTTGYSAGKAYGHNPARATSKDLRRTSAPFGYSGSPTTHVWTAFDAIFAHFVQHARGNPRTSALDRDHSDASRSQGSSRHWERVQASGDSTTSLPAIN